MLKVILRARLGLKSTPRERHTGIRTLWGGTRRHHQPAPLRAQMRLQTGRAQDVWLRTALRRCRPLAAHVDNGNPGA